MKEELDSYLCTTYPKMFVNRNASMQETAMCWGFCCGDGWFQILRNLCQNIQSHIDWKNSQRQVQIDLFNAREQGFDSVLKLCQGRSAFASDWDHERAEEIMANSVVIPDEIPQVVVAQVKEKFGTLRFYYDGGDEYISGLVRMAESMSGVTCEECGAPGTTNGGGWVRTLCEKHEAEYQQRRNSDD